MSSFKESKHHEIYESHKRDISINIKRFLSLSYKDSHYYL